jgi:thiol peroxidase
MERTGVVTFFGNPLTLVGREIKVGGKAPGFALLDPTMKEVKLSDFSGRIKVISVTPSLDTPVCDLQARTFDRKARSLSDRVVVLNVSMDLPFAIGRYASARKISNLLGLSDHRDGTFGKAYGVLVKELRLLARSIFVIDGKDVIRYVEIVPEMTTEPDYARALAAAKKLAG